jgi:hypothetical protein
VATRPVRLVLLLARIIAPPPEETKRKKTCPAVTLSPENFADAGYTTLLIGPFCKGRGGRLISADLDAGRFRKCLVSMGAGTGRQRTINLTFIARAADKLPSATAGRRYQLAGEAADPARWGREGHAAPPVVSSRARTDIKAYRRRGKSAKSRHFSPRARASAWPAVSRKSARGRG